MADEKLKDRSGKLLGTIHDRGDKAELRDTSGKLLGIYDKKHNKTTDTSGRLIGTGNLLTTLLR